MSRTSCGITLLWSLFVVPDWSSQLEPLINWGPLWSQDLLGSPLGSLIRVGLQTWSLNWVPNWGPYL